MKSFDFYIDFHFVNLFNSSFSSGILGLKEPRTPILKKKILTLMKSLFIAYAFLHPKKKILKVSRRANQIKSFKTEAKLRAHHLVTR